jgi:hypothetical protein
MYSGGRGERLYQYLTKEGVRTQITKEIIKGTSSTKVRRILNRLTKAREISEGFGINSSKVVAYSRAIYTTRRKRTIIEIMLNPRRATRKVSTSL